MSAVGRSSEEHGASKTQLAAIVAIPACNEAQRIGACLDALAAQRAMPMGALGVLVFLNNCTDATRDVVEARRAAFPWPLRVIECDSATATAGWARREAMEAAAAWLEAEGAGSDGVVLTSDADTRVAPDWVARNLAAIDAGADLVGGVFELDEEETLPASLQARARREARYEALLVEIAARLDPEPGNPWPTHWSKSGASLAVRLAAYRRVGGMPALDCGEDQAFVDRIRAHDLIVRQDPAIVVVTSGRLDGRATGGSADTIARRAAAPDMPCDAPLERLDRLVRRVLWRAHLRRMHAAGRLREDDAWVARLAVPPSIAASACATRFSGRAVALVETASPRLAFRPLTQAALPRQTWLAGAMLALLRWRDARRAGRRAGSLESAPAAAG